MAFKSILFLILILPSLAVADLSVFVSVLPHKMMLERLGGGYVQVSVMVGKGFNPATYQPTPRQISALAGADLYLRTGVPFEDSWLPRFQAINPQMQVVDLRDGIESIQVTGPVHGRPGPGNSLDPHIWTDPLLLAQQAALVRDLLQQRLPQQASNFELNYQRLNQELSDLDQQIRNLLDKVEQRSFLVFHPAWGYFARRYGWQQVAAEHEGKEPNARQLARLMEQAKQLGIKRVIIQPQNNSRAAPALVEAIQGKLVVADPLAENYVSSLLDFARLLGESND